MALRRIMVLGALCAVCTLSSVRAETMTICTAVADVATGEMLKEEGACDTRAPPLRSPSA